jgi:hypothetical protein
MQLDERQTQLIGTGAARCGRVDAARSGSDSYPTRAVARAPALRWRVSPLRCVRATGSRSKALHGESRERDVRKRTSNCETTSRSNRAGRSGALAFLKTPWELGKEAVGDFLKNLL